MKKTGVFFLMLLLCFLTGCGKIADTGETRITVDGKGRIIATVLEAFEKKYYDEKELKASVQSAVDTYNKKAGEEYLTLDKFKVSRGVASVTIGYDTDEDYQAFNMTKIYNGKLTGLSDAGYDILTEVTDRDGKTLPLQKLAAEKKKYHVAVLSENCRLETEERILYTSSNVTVQGRRIAHVKIDDKAEYAFVVYK